MCLRTWFLFSLLGFQIDCELSTSCRSFYGTFEFDRRWSLLLTAYCLLISCNNGSLKNKTNIGYFYDIVSKMLYFSAIDWSSKPILMRPGPIITICTRFPSKSNLSSHWSIPSLTKPSTLNHGLNAQIMILVYVACSRPISPVSRWAQVGIKLGWACVKIRLQGLRLGVLVSSWHVSLMLYQTSQ